VDHWLWSLPGSPGEDEDEGGRMGEGEENAPDLDVESTPLQQPRSKSKSVESGNETQASPPIRQMKKGEKVLVCGVAVLATDTWATNQTDFDAWHAESDFTIDLAAEPKTAKLARFYTPADDALTQSWAGERGFLNPEYSRGRLERWLGKVWQEVSKGGCELVAALVPHDASTRWWRMWVRALADGQDPNVTVEIRELGMRPKFVHPDTGELQKGNKRPCALVIYRAVAATPGAEA
jgi:phage N-6-adenine-methyltransferase